MSELPSLELVLTWPQAVVAVVIVFALIMWPGLLAWLNSRAARVAAEDTRHQVQPNSGKSMRDSTNRVEIMVSTMTTKLDAHIIESTAHRAELDARLAALERRRRRRRLGF
jgi:hypothetical protein